MNLRRIVVRLPNWLGDGVMAVPALRALRRRFPAAEIVLHGRGAFEPLLADAGLFDRFDPRGRSGTAEQAAALARLEADAIVILPHSVRSAVEAWRAGIPVRLGYERDGRSRLLTHTLSPHRGARGIVPVPMHQQYLELVGVLGADGDVSDGALGAGEEACAAADRWLAERGIGPGERPLALNPGASFGPSKVYPPRLLAAAARRAAAGRDLPVLILCGPGEEALAEEVERELRTGADPSLRIASAASAPPALDVLKGVLRRVAVLITTDSGPRHMATALDVPTVVVMGPTDPRFTAARLERSVVLRVDVPCGPCHEKVCPLDHRCMTEIAPEEVAAAAEVLAGFH